jgi:hypothetical protein
MIRRSVLVAGMAAVAGITGAAPAAAHQNPVGCNSNRLHLDITRDHSLVRIGDIINYSVDLDNVGPSACDVSIINVMLQFPGLDGTPSKDLQQITNNASYAAQLPKFSFPSRAYTVAANPGVTRIEARTSVANGELHDGAVHSPVNINKNIGATIFTPSITIDKVGSMTGPAPAPQTVKYTFYVRNGTDPSLGADATSLSNVSVTDDKCGSPTYMRGDANDNHRLETTETWEFECTLTHPAPGTYTNTAVANGENILYGRSVPVVSPPDNWTVVLVAAPQVAVKPVAVSQAPCTVARVNSTTVRAGQLNTIRVRVRNVDAGTTVKVTLPGGKTVSAKTNKDGIATLRVRPPKSGTAKIEAAECSDVERLSVKPARRVVAQRAPRVTG